MKDSERRHAKAEAKQQAATKNERMRVETLMMKLNGKIELLEDQLDKSRNDVGMQANEICHLRD